MYELTGPKSPFHWEIIHKEAFAALKESLVSAPVLANPNAQDMFILDTDASDTAISAELLQLQDGEEKVISYGSFTLNPAQRNTAPQKKNSLQYFGSTGNFVITCWEDNSLSALTIVALPG